MRGEVRCHFCAGMLHEETVRSIGDQHLAPQYIPLRTDRPYDYAEQLIIATYHQGPLVLVEHDVVPPPGSIQALFECPEPWCGHAVELRGGPRCYTLSLVKFSAALLERDGYRLRLALSDRLSGAASVPWSKCDTAIARALHIAGFRYHRHTPDATHLHAYGQIEEV